MIMKSIFTRRRVFCSIGLMALVIIILQMYSNRQLTMAKEMSKPHIVFGILSAENQAERRYAQRNTWLSTAMHAELPFKLTYKFLIDLPTMATIKENEIHNDIVYLNVTHHGYVVKFGQKIYIWIKYILENYPDAYLGARIDDDVFLCVPEIFKRLDAVKSSKLYYGYNLGGNKKRGVSRHIDEMFVVLGKELMQRITRRDYCKDMKRCNATTQLVEFERGGVSLARWVSIYDDIDFKADNNRMVFYARTDYEIYVRTYAQHVNADFCDNLLLYHKSSPDIMLKLHSRYYRSV